MCVREGGRGGGKERDEDERSDRISRSDLNCKPSGTCVRGCRCARLYVRTSLNHIQLDTVGRQFEAYLTAGCVCSVAPLSWTLMLFRIGAK